MNSMAFLSGHDDLETMLFAHPVGDGPYLLVIALGVAVVLLPRDKVDGIEYDVGVDMPCVGMDADHGLVFGEAFFRELPGDFEGQFWRDLPVCKALDDVVSLDAIQLTHLPLGFHHLAIRIFRPAVVIGGEHLFLRFVPVNGVSEHDVQPGTLGEYFGYRHFLTASSSFSYTLSSRNRLCAAVSGEAIPALTLRAI